MSAHEIFMTIYPYPAATIGMGVFTAWLLIAVADAGGAA